jgi:hypothetical protein
MAHVTGFSAAPAPASTGVGRLASRIVDDMRTRRLAVIAVALFVAVGCPLGAQRLRGRVLLPDSATAARGIIVAALDQSGKTVRSALTGERGEFDLALPRAGRYGVRALRIGFRPTVVRLIDVTEGEERTLQIVLRPEGVVLAAVTVRGQRSCRVSADSGQAVAEVFDEARKAVTAAQLSESNRSLVVRWLVFDRQTNLDRSRTFSERLSKREGVTDRAFSSASPDSLARVGYVHNEKDSTVFNAPDAEALLSDQFAAMHCFHLEPPPAAHPDWVGVGFAPPSDRERIVDIQGTFWLDRASAELRLLEYSYTNLRYEFAAANLGGVVEFLRLPTGNWLVNRWEIRMPEWFSARVSGRRVVDRLHIAGGEVTSVERDGVSLYNATGTGTGAATALGGGLSRGPLDTVRIPSISGTLYDSLSNGVLPNAVVHVQDLAVTARSDSVGRFQFDSLPAGRQLLWLEHPRLDALGLYTVAAAVDVTPGATVIMAAGIPSFATLWHRACGERPAPVADTGFVFGHVSRATATRADSEAFVQVAWRGHGASPAGSAGTRPSPADSAGTRPTISRARVASDGTFAVCGVPASERVSVRASDAAFATPPMALHTGALRIARRDLTLADPDVLMAPENQETPTELLPAGQGATVYGAVTRADGSAIAGARIVVAGVAGEARTNEAGRYVVSRLPGGTRRVTVEVLGFLPAHTVADLYSDDSVRVDATLSKVTRLAGVTVRERAVMDERARYLDQRRRAGWAYFMDSTAIRRAILVQHAISAPGVEIASLPGGWQAYTIRPSMSSGGKSGWKCIMPMFVDGHAADDGEITSLKALDRIAWIEVYNHYASLAQDLMHGTIMLGGRGDCGVIMFWTKDYLEP